jgi:hypothetical protein
MAQAQRKTKLRVYLCKEGREEFTLEAESLTQAQEYAALYNAVVICELK